MHIYDMKLQCPFCSYDNLSIFQLQIHIYEKHPDEELFKKVVDIYILIVYGVL